mmetsp:Transcript_33126/g.55795  ORF Transcript_33126/g.55795 Transcript_33126/m.55795 type:complete len:314 (-) Transcript_33126:194-1135(-)
MSVSPLPPPSPTPTRPPLTHSATSVSSTTASLENSDPARPTPVFRSPSRRPRSPTVCVSSSRTAVSRPTTTSSLAPLMPSLESFLPLAASETTSLTGVARPLPPTPLAVPSSARPLFAETPTPSSRRTLTSTSTSVSRTSRSTMPSVLPPTSVSPLTLSLTSFPRMRPFSPSRPRSTLTTTSTRSSATPRSPETEDATLPRAPSPLPLTSSLRLTRATFRHGALSITSRSTSPTSRPALPSASSLGPRMSASPRLEASRAQETASLPTILASRRLLSLLTVRALPMLRSSVTPSSRSSPTVPASTLRLVASPP